MSVNLIVKRLDHGKDLPLPSYATADAAGMDLRAALAEPITLRPGDRILVPTALVVEIPRGYEGQVRPRSGLALKHGISMVNTPGTVDSDYRGELKVIMINHGQDDFVINHGERIAQLVISPVVQATIVEADEVSESGRGAGGFGSTGVK
jgi:dUTP pyrophosphatase